MVQPELDSRLPLMQNAVMNDKVVLLRVDHNVVKKGAIEDPYRIDSTLGTLYNIVEAGGRPILMTHVGRPKDKKTGFIKTEDKTSVRAVVNYLERKLQIKFVVPELPADPERGIVQLDDAIGSLIEDLRARRIAGIYLPNTRWFEGEEAKGGPRDRFARDLASMADIYVNDAFGSWQPHASTYDVTGHLPSFAGLLMQKELANLSRVLEPERPFTAVIAGAKYDTKIGPVTEMYKKVDHLILGGVLYNTYLCAKYGIKVQGVEDSDVELARALVKLDENAGKVLELSAVVESDILEGRKEGMFRTVRISEFKPGAQYKYFLDAAPESFDDPKVREALAGAKTIFVNAVMGLTPHFWRGSEKLYAEIDANKDAMKLYGGGDTLQELKNIRTRAYLDALDDPKDYFFTGGGAVLKAVEEGSPYGIEPVRALIDNGGRILK